jgi:hypothetical protein
MIQALYTTATSVVMVNGADSQPISIANGVRQGDALSCLLFVLVMELLGCTLRTALPQEAFLKLQSGRMTHAYYMDDTVVFLSSVQYYYRLTQALDKYCAGTNALFNADKTDLLLVGHSSEDVPSDLPIQPVPNGTPIRYLGGYIGNNIKHADIVDKFIDDLLLHAKKVACIPASLPGRAAAIATYTISKAIFISRFVPFQAGQTRRIDQALGKILWDRSRPYMNRKVAALPLSRGGLRFPTVESIIYAANIQFVHKFCRLATQHHSAADTGKQDPIPPWLPNLLACWRIAVSKNKGRQIIQFFKDAPQQRLKSLLLNPFIQTKKQCKLPASAWP